MILSLADLSYAQVSLIDRLCVDGPDDGIGCELMELSDDDLIVAQTLFPLGLIEIVEGWRGTHWLMLTGTGWRTIDAGFAE